MTNLNRLGGALLMSSGALLLVSGAIEVNEVKAAAENGVMQDYIAHLFVSLFLFLPGMALLRWGWGRWDA